MVIPNTTRSFLFKKRNDISYGTVLIRTFFVQVIFVARLCEYDPVSFLFRYDIAALPLSEDGLSEWLKQRWVEKEQQLKLFETTKCFPAASSGLEPRAGDSQENHTKPSTNGVGPLPSAGKPALRDESMWREDSIKWRYGLVIIFWLAFLVVSMYLLYMYALIRVLVLLQVLFFLVIGKWYGGVEIFLAEWFSGRSVAVNKKED